MQHDLKVKLGVVKTFEKGVIRVLSEEVLWGINHKGKGGEECQRGWLWMLWRRYIYVSKSHKLEVDFQDFQEYDG